MNKLLLGLGGVVAVGGLLAVVAGVSAVGINNQCVGQEQGLTARYKNNKNVYDTFTKKVKEVAQVPDMYTQDLKSVITADVSGRYGKDGSKAVFQFLKEHNVSLDASLYKQVQQVIESGRNEFQVNQTELLDRKRVYETYLNTFPQSLVAKFLGFPKIDLKEIDIVTSAHTDAAFDTKKDEPIKLR